VAARGRVDVAAEEVVHGLVPFAGELEPVAAVPPVGVELAVGEACTKVSMTIMVMSIGALVRVISAKAPSRYSKMTRKTSRKITMNGKSRRPIVSPRIRPKSDALVEFWRRTEDSFKMGRTKCSVHTVMRKIQPKTARVL
jgi:hypothetical protein